jgi:hypothetical protein
MQFDGEAIFQTRCDMSVVKRQLISEIPFNDDRMNRLSLQRTDRTPTGLEESFDTLLKAAMDPSITTSPSQPAPIDRDRLLQLVETVRAQMNERLYRAIIDDDEAERDYGTCRTYDRWLNLPVPDRTEDGSTSALPDPARYPEVPADRRGLEEIIYRASRTYGVDPALIRGIIKTESNFNTRATSPKGALGLMQLMPSTARDLGVDNPYDPLENVMAGTRYLKNLLNRYDGDVTLALAAYNWGMGNLEKHPERMPRETRNYVQLVTREYRKAGV